MNRSLRAQESQIPASVKLRQQVKEKEEEPALFLEMRKHEKEHGNLLLENSDDFDSPLGIEPGTSPIFNITSTAPARKTGSDDFLNSENDKNDYDWLLTPPGTPLFSSLEMESQKTVASPKARLTALKSRLANPKPEPAARSNSASRQSASSPGLNNSSIGVRRPSSSGGPSRSRPATPTGRPTLTSACKPTLITSSKSMLTTTAKPTLATVSKPSRSATPTSRATLPSIKPTVLPRSSTPVSRTTPRSSTPTTRPTLPASKTTSRAPTPTRRPTNTSAPPVKSPTFSSVTKPAGPTTARNNPVPPPRANSPAVKSRPWKPSEMPGYSLDAPPNLRTSLPDRPLSATRGRPPGPPIARSSSVEPVSNGRVRRQSCSPSRGRPPNGAVRNSGSSVPVVSRMHAKANDNVSPVLIGTKMVDRVVNMRKLVPPKQDDKHSPRSNLSGKSSSPDSSGFGRTLSKKSLDMAMRHMDIRRRIPGNLRPLMTNIPASSMYSVRPGPNNGLRLGPTHSSRTISVSDSPLATSSNASSEMSSVNNNGLLCVYGSEAEDDLNSDKGAPSPSSIQGR